MAALQALTADLAGGPSGNGRAHLAFRQSPFEDRLELGRIAVEVPRLPGTHRLPVRLEVGADGQHAVGGVLDEADVTAAAVVGGGGEGGDAHVDSL